MTKRRVSGKFRLLASASILFLREPCAVVSEPFASLSLSLSMKCTDLLERRELIEQRCDVNRVYRQHHERDHQQEDPHIQPEQLTAPADQRQHCVQHRQPYCHRQREGLNFVHEEEA